MHPLFHLRCDFPYHPNIRPLFISFHLYRLDMLSAEGLAYLRRYGPVGCRDWTTVDVLLGAGVDAFFTGCLTTTVDALFPERDDADVGGGAVGVIDLPASAAGRRAGDVRVFTHQYEDVRGMSVTDGIRAANERLGGYQRDLGRAVTNRLHAYLPLTSLGVPVQFAPANPGDVRFAGLTGLQPGDARLEAMRGGIRDLVEQAFGWILAGADEATVYGRWRELVGGRVAEAKSRFLEPVTRPVTTMDVRAAVSAARSGRRRFGPHDSVGGSVTDLVVAFDHTLLWPAAVLIESVIANATGPLRLWVLGRGVPATYQDWFAGAFPSLPVTFIQAPSHDPVDVGNSTMDLLLVPDILEDVDRVVYLAVDTLMLGDVCELATVDLGGRPLAARDTKVSEASEWRRVGHRLGEGPASDLRRSMGAQHGYGSPALNAGVLVMDLARMRRDGFTETALGGVERYGFSREDALLAYVGPERAALEARWNGLPAIEDVDDPCVIDWAGFDKPWEPRLTHGQARWRAYAAQLQARAGAPPGADLDGSVAPHPGLRTERRGGSHVVGA
jgi:lipopolysaccharide biosynthesis glycosyltransferase